MVTLPLPDDLAAALEDRDPLHRYRAAADASDAIAAYLETVQADAARALVAAHDGNVAAAARELGFNNRQAFRQWLGRRSTNAGDTPETGPARAQEQPALYFESQEEAEAALEDYAAERREVEDRVEPLVLGALATGLAPETVYRRTGIPLATIARLRPTEIQVAVNLNSFSADEILADTARALTAHAKALMDAAPDGDRGAIGAAHIWSFATRALVKNLAPEALWEADPPHVTALREAYYDIMGTRRAELQAAHPEWEEAELSDHLREDMSPELAAAEKAFFAAQDEHTRSQPGANDTDQPTHLSADAWLAAQISEFNRQAAACESSERIDPTEPDSGPYQEALGRAFRDLAAAYLHLRTTGTVPTLTTPEAHQ